MEVHAHTHTPRRKWTHYFWEFLMLFLAVFCGFLAEYQLEHTIEKQREKQFMKSMVKDLEQDVLNGDINLEKRIQTIDRCNNIYRLFNDLRYQDSTGLIYYQARSLSAYFNLYVMTDGTIQQLKNSGGLRLIKNRAVVDSIQAYENLFARFERDQQTEQLQLALYRDQMLRIFDVRVFESILQNNGTIIMPDGNPPLFNNERSVFNDFLMRLHFLKRNNIINYNSIANLMARSQKLIALIKKEYHLE